MLETGNYQTDLAAQKAKPSFLAGKKGLWRSFNSDLKERMNRLYQSRQSCAMAHGF
jgi:hypothetical protein